MAIQTKEPLMTFPCTFPLKVMAVTGHHFENDLIEIVGKHVPDFDKNNINQKASKNAKYTAFTITFLAQSREQLDALYREINKHPDVRVVL